MVTILAGKQLRRDIVKKNPSTISSVREETAADLQGEAGGLIFTITSV